MAKKSKQSLSSNKFIYPVVAIVALVILGLIYNHYHSSTSQLIQSTASKPQANSSPSQGSSSADKQVAPPTPSPSSPSSPKDTGNNAHLITPYGNFVSNHSPGGSAPFAEQSSCITTPGANCYIKFTKDNDSRSLATQTADSNGNVIWNWDAKSFPSGTWQITATASLNGQTKTATDATPLTIP